MVFSFVILVSGAKRLLEGVGLISFSLSCFLGLFFHCLLRDARDRAGGRAVCVHCWFSLACCAHLAPSCCFGMVFGVTGINRRGRETVHGVFAWACAPGRGNWIFAQRQRRLMTAIGRMIGWSMMVFPSAFSVQYAAPICFNIGSSLPPVCFPMARSSLLWSFLSHCYILVCCVFLLSDTLFDIQIARLWPCITEVE